MDVHLTDLCRWSSEAILEISKNRGAIPPHAGQDASRTPGDTSETLDVLWTSGVHTWRVRTLRNGLPAATTKCIVGYLISANH